jgi:hypothetical protein
MRRDRENGSIGGKRPHLRVEVRRAFAGRAAANLGSPRRAVLMVTRRLKPHGSFIKGRALGSPFLGF